MNDDAATQCTHLDKRITWLGVRKLGSRKVFVFQCQSCGRTFCTHTPFLSMTDTRQLMKAATLA